MNLEIYFEKYRRLVGQVDAAFDKIRIAFDDCVSCKVGCADCCYALFDLSLVEALHIKKKFDENVPDAMRSKIIERANEADRKIYRLKRQAFKKQQAGKSEREIFTWLSAQRVRCPLLNDNDQCDLYESRPITCRLYGVPTVIGDQAHTCGLSGFKEGESYPTAKLNPIHQKLYDISSALAREIQSRYPKLAEMLVPLSMALLTDYTEEYLGVRSTDSESSEEKGSGKGE